jgi:hypothetical protein
MALSEFEVKRMEKMVGRFIEKRRPEPHLRDKIDLSFKLSGQSFEIFNVRARHDDPVQKIEDPIAKATYVKSKKQWKLFWMSADLKWHSYQPLPYAKSLEETLDVIDKDAHHCFWG